MATEGGGGGIRTHEGRQPLEVFKTSAIKPLGDPSEFRFVGRRRRVQDVCFAIPANRGNEPVHLGGEGGIRTHDTLTGIAR